MCLEYEEPFYIGHKIVFYKKTEKKILKGSPVKLRIHLKTMSDENEGYSTVHISLFIFYINLYIVINFMQIVNSGWIHFFHLFSFTSISTPAISTPTNVK